MSTAASVEGNAHQLEEKAHKSLRRWMWWSAGAGLIPVPIVDAGAILGMQLKMVSEIAAVYDVEFRKSLGKSIITTLISSLGATGLAYGAVGTWLKSIPGPGSLVGMLSMPGFAAASTWAVGRVFIMHFASGGTMLNFDPEAMSDHFKREFESAKNNENGEGAEASTEEAATA